MNDDIIKKFNIIYEKAKFRIPILFMLCFFIIERIFFTFTSMPFEHASFSGWNAMFIWHFLPFTILSTLWVIMVELFISIYRKLI